MVDGVAFVTVTYNSADDLRTSWAGFDRLTEWIVVDNRSSDDSAAVARDLGARVIESGENRGFSAANNLAVRETAAEVLIFVNPDVTVDSAGAERLAELCRERNAIVAPQLLNVDGSLQENGRGAPFLYRKVMHFLGRDSEKYRYEVTAQPGETTRVSWVMGAAVAIPRRIFEAIGGWDDGFFIYYEDADICLRAARLGYPTLLAGDVRWTHSWTRATRRESSLKIWKIELKSGLRFYRRYLRLLLPFGLPWRGKPWYAEDVS